MRFNCGAMRVPMRFHMHKSLTCKTKHVNTIRGQIRPRKVSEDIVLIRNSIIMFLQGFCLNHAKIKLYHYSIIYEKVDIIVCVAQNVFVETIRHHLLSHCLGDSAYIHSYSHLVKHE